MGSEAVHKEMTSYAMYVDQSLQAKGVDPASKSEEYYNEVDNAMRNQFPTFFGVTSTPEIEISQEDSPKRQPTTVVASATRDSGNKKPTQIRLSQTQVKLARQLGISPEQYANQLLKEVLNSQKKIITLMKWSQFLLILLVTKSVPLGKQKAERLPNTHKIGKMCQTYHHLIHKKAGYLGTSELPF